MVEIAGHSHQPIYVVTGDRRQCRHRRPTGIPYQIEPLSIEAGFQRIDSAVDGIDNFRGKPLIRPVDLRAQGRSGPGILTRACQIRGVALRVSQRQTQGYRVKRSRVGRGLVYGPPGKTITFKINRQRLIFARFGRKVSYQLKLPRRNMNRMPAMRDCQGIGMLTPFVRGGNSVASRERQRKENQQRVMQTFKSDIPECNQTSSEKATDDSVAFSLRRADQNAQLSLAEAEWFRKPVRYSAS